MTPVPTLPRRPRLRVLAVSAALAVAGALVPGMAAAPAVAAGCPAPGGQPAPDAAVPANAEVAVLGHGFGHSMGLSQYGAQGAATLGCDYGTILRAYYPGLNLGTVTLQPRVLIDMLAAGGARGYATLAAEGDSVGWSRGLSRVTQPAGSTWTVRPRVQGGVRTGVEVLDAAGRVVPALSSGAAEQVRATHSDPAAGTATVVRLRTWTTSPDGTAAVGLHDRRSRYDHTRFSGDVAGLTVREVMEDNALGRGVVKYLRGIAELPASWHVEAFTAQIVAARSYLAGRPVVDGGYLILPTPAHQNWTGATREEEDARFGQVQRRAVDRTSTSNGRGTVMVAPGGGLARDLLYTSSHGGWSETNRYVFGSAPVGHLRQVDDSRWDAASGNPNRSWAVGLSFAQLAKAFGFTTVTTVTTAPQGSPDRTGVVVTGTIGATAATRTFTGWDSRQRLRTVAGTTPEGRERVLSPGFTFRNLTIGGPGAHAIAGDWDGDGRDERGWYRDGRVVLQQRDGTLLRYAFGTRGDVPVVGDWDGDGRDEVGIFRAGAWHLRFDRSSGPADRAFRFGVAGDRPVTGRWPGAAGDGVGVVRGNLWHLRRSADTGPAQLTAAFGRASDVPVVGDWDGNGTDTLGVRRGGIWYLTDSVPAGAVGTVAFGRAGDVPVVGDWDGDGRSTPGIVRDVTWHWRDDLAGGAGTAAARFAG